MKNSPIIMFLFGVVAFIAIMVVAHKKDIDMASAQFWFYRVLTALAAASISISIPGMLKVNYTPKGDRVNTLSDENNNPVPMTLAEKEPAITASGAIAVFILVYMFNPI